MSVGLGLGVAWPEILRALIAANRGRIAVSRTLGMKRLVKLWIAAVVLLTSIVETVAQPKAGETAAQPKQILLLYPYGQNFQPWVTWGREIRRELNLQSSWPLDVQAHSLFTALSGDDDADAKFVEYLRALYAQSQPDLIVALGGPSAQFVQQHRADLFPTTPMLLGAVNVRRVAQSMLVCGKTPWWGRKSTSMFYSTTFSSCCRKRKPSRSLSETLRPSDFGSARCSAN